MQEERDVLEANELLELWEAGAAGSHARRGLLLHAASTSRTDLSELDKLPVGERDAALISLHEVLFGTRAECVVACEACSAPLELGVDLQELRLPTQCAEGEHRLSCGGYQLRFRAVTGADLSALSGLSDLDAAVTRLVECCVIEARDEAGVVAAATLPRAVVDALSRRLAELDPQAEVVLALACAMCGAEQLRPFDIVEQLWARVDALARTLLAEVHTLASAYGWSEANVLSMSARRRRSYLSLCGAY